LEKELTDDAKKMSRNQVYYLAVIDYGLLSIIVISECPNKDRPKKKSKKKAGKLVMLLILLFHEKAFSQQTRDIFCSKVTFGKYKTFEESLN